MQVPFLGSIPLDPRIARACDEGKNFLQQHPDSPATVAYGSIIQSNNSTNLFFLSIMIHN